MRTTTPSRREIHAAVNFHESEPSSRGISCFGSLPHGKGETSANGGLHKCSALRKRPERARSNVPFPNLTDRPHRSADFLRAMCDLRGEFPVLTRRSSKMKPTTAFFLADPYAPPRSPVGLAASIRSSFERYFPRPKAENRSPTRPRFTPISFRARSTGPE